jgi:hypothetical protein
MQFVRVLFPRSRKVEVDNTIVGVTNQVLLVEEGFHRIDLGQPVNYTPKFLDVTVTNSTPANPMEIQFTVLSAVTGDDDDGVRIPVKGGETPVAVPHPVAVMPPPPPRRRPPVRSRSKR